MAKRPFASSNDDDEDDELFQSDNLPIICAADASDQDQGATEMRPSATPRPSSSVSIVEQRYTPVEPKVAAVAEFSADFRQAIYGRVDRSRSAVADKTVHIFHCANFSGRLSPERCPPCSVYKLVLSVPCLGIR